VDIECSYVGVCPSVLKIPCLKVRYFNNIFCLRCLVTYSCYMKRIILDVHNHIHKDVHNEHSTPPIGGGARVSIMNIRRPPIGANRRRRLSIMDTLMIKAQIGKPKNTVTPSPKLVNRLGPEQMECHAVAQNCYSILAQTFESLKVLANIKCCGYQEVQLSKQLLSRPITFHDSRNSIENAQTRGPDCSIRSRCRCRAFGPASIYTISVRQDSFFFPIIIRDKTEKNKSSKRKARESLGDHIDGVPVNTDLNEPTMGEKLASLNLTENSGAKSHDVESSPQTKPPSADSVHILLNQALHADDRALLVDCLFRQDDKLIESRLSTFNHTLQLSSCLELLYAETVDDDVEEDNSKVTPILYEDNDEGSIDSMETESNHENEQPHVSDDEINDEIDY
ncbi:Hypothetical predicted protein, partial [Olea europaea subsp. europaea]